MPKIDINKLTQAQKDKLLLDIIAISNKAKYPDDLYGDLAELLEEVIELCR